MSAHTDSPTGRQFHVRYRVRSHQEWEGPYWSHVYDDEVTAREVLRSFEADADLTNVELWIRTVTPWRQVSVVPATACPHGHPVGEHCGICGSGVRG